MAFTRTFTFAKLLATDLVNDSIPPFAAEYASRPRLPMTPATDVMLMIDPPPLAVRPANTVTPVAP